MTKYSEWNIERPDIIVAGFPCQSYSICGNRLGLADERGGKVVYPMFKIIEKYKPKYLLLENVKGLLNIDKGGTFKEIIDTLEGFGYDVNWKIINSALVSAQNRERVFISNIPFDMPQDKNIPLKDVVFKDGLLLSEKALEYMDREVTGGRTHWDFKHHSDVRNPKSAAVVANFFKGVPYNVLKDWNCIRYFDPVEVERLQTFPDNYTEGVSKTQRYKALGNSFTVDVIAHILRGIE